MILNKGDIMNAPDLRRETVAVPEWGEGAEVIVQEMTALDRDRFRKTMYDENGDLVDVNLTARILVRCIVDEEGNRIFTDDEAESLGKKSQNVLQRLLKVAEGLNGAGQADEAIKNSEPSQSESLHSD